MTILKAAAASVAFAALASTGAIAQSATDNRGQPNPAATQPAEPMAPSSDGASAGDSGVTTPAGNPSDPTTNENVQPGMSTNTPNDPAAGSNPSARVPTSPAGTGTSSP